MTPTGTEEDASPCSCSRGIHTPPAEGSDTPLMGGEWGKEWTRPRSPSSSPLRPLSQGEKVTRPKLRPVLAPALSPLLHPAAALVLARFARRLPGFGNSSAGYLRCNFLAGRARVTFLPDMIEVSVGRPPLDLVLAMAGKNRSRQTGSRNTGSTSEPAHVARMRKRSNA